MVQDRIRQEALLAEVRAAFRSLPPPPGHPPAAALHRCGAALLALRDLRAYRRDDSPGFVGLCAALSCELRGFGVGMARRYMRVAAGYRAEELRGVRVSLRLLLDLLRVPAPRRAELLQKARAESPRAAQRALTRALESGEPLPR